MESTEEIRRRTETCMDLFSRCSSNALFSKLEWFENRQAEFNLWSASLKAASIGRASLDHRVRQTPEVRELICDLLGGLSEALETILKTVEHKPSAQTQEAEKDPLPEPDDDAGSVFSGFSSDNGVHSRSVPSIGKAGGLFSEPMLNVRTIIGQLARISTTIRRSGAKYRSHAADASLKEEEFEDYRKDLTLNVLLSHLDTVAEELVPIDTRLARLTDSKQLSKVQERLINANVVRRNRIIAATRSMMPEEMQPPKQPQRKPAPVLDMYVSVAEPTPQFPQEHTSQISREPAILLQANSIRAASVTRTATNIGSQFDFRSAIEPEKQAASVVTRATRIGAMQDYPSCPPPISDEWLQCPYCADLLPTAYIQNRSRWRGHVARDILPYICISQQCQTPDEMYLTSDEVTKHMQNQHGVTRWVCDHCTSKSQGDTGYVFQRLEDWEVHMKSNHNTFPTSRLPQLAKLSERKMLSPMACPLCGYATKQAHSTLDSHIAEHLHAFALRCLPWGTGGNDEDSINAKSASTTNAAEINDQDYEDMWSAYPGVTEANSIVQTFKAFRARPNPVWLDEALRMSLLLIDKQLTQHLRETESLSELRSMQSGVEKGQPVILASFISTTRSITSVERSRMSGNLPSYTYSTSKIPGPMIKLLELLTSHLLRIVYILREMSEYYDSADSNTNGRRSRMGLLKDELEILETTMSESQAHTGSHQDPGFDQCLADLRITDPRQDKARIEQTKGGLLRDSYRWILSNAEFRRWHQGNGPNLLWIKGDPGKGKTMLLCGIIDELRHFNSHDTLSFFFCQASDFRLNNAIAILRGIVFLILQQEPHLTAHVQRRYAVSGPSIFYDPNAWLALSDMFTAIVEDLSSAGTDIIVLVDALDECTEGLQQFIPFMTKTSTKYSHLKYIVSSRNRPDIEKQLRLSAACLSLELNADLVDTGISAYIQQKVDHLGHRKLYDKKAKDALQSYLLSNSNGTFLWVSLMCRQLEIDPYYEASSTLHKAPVGLDDQYIRMIQNLNKSQDTRLLKQILAVALVAYRPLSRSELAIFLRRPGAVDFTPEMIEGAAQSCDFLTLRGETVNLIHVSVKNFLLDRSHYRLFPNGLKKIHYLVFSMSLPEMGSSLRQNIYDLRSPGFPVRQVQPPDPDPLARIRYSCVYWIKHFLHSPPEEVLDTVYSIYKFFETNFLHWVEALSLLQSLSEGIRALGELEKSPVIAQSDPLLRFVRDAHRFVLSHRSGIENAPLQVYASALLFGPSQSLVRSLFAAQQPTWISRQTVRELRWSSCRQTLEGHQGIVHSVAFSPDNLRIVSASSDKNIRLWAAATGACKNMLIGHTNTVYSVAFSPDGQRIVSASSDKTVRLWATATGRCENVLIGHTNTVYSAAFSPRGQRIASASSDGTILLWDAATGECMATLEGHGTGVCSAVFSPDELFIISGSEDATIRIWYPDTGACLQTLSVSESVLSLAISPDGKRTLSGSESGKVMVWDILAGRCVQTLKAHSGPISSVAFAGDGKRAGSASITDNTINIWDPTTGLHIQRLSDYHVGVLSISLSTNGQFLVSASTDFTVKIWDVASQSGLHQPQHQNVKVNFFAFSAEGKHAASISGTTLEIWDLDTGSSKQILWSEDFAITSASFSPDGKEIVTGSMDRTIRVWVVSTGIHMKSFKCQASITSSIAFSPSGLNIASTSDNTIWIWDKVAGQCLQRFDSHGESIISVTYSLDGRMLASTLSSCVIEIWNLSTGQHQNLGGLQSEVTSVAFSRNGRQLVSSAEDKTISIWDIASNRRLRTIWMGALFCSMSFDPSERYLVTDVGRVEITRPPQLPGTTSAASSDDTGFTAASGGGSSLDKQEPKWNGYGLSLDKSWITCNGQNILWLPVEHRPIRSAVVGQTAMHKSFSQ